MNARRDCTASGSLMGTGCGTALSCANDSADGDGTCSVWYRFAHKDSIDWPVSPFEVTSIKYAICMTAPLFLLGTTASSYGQQEKQQEGHAQEEKPAQEHAKPAPQQHAQESKPAAAPHEQAAKPAAQQHTQSSAHSTQTHTTTTVSHTTESYAASQNHGDGGHDAHGRISEAHYSASFGSQHSFHVNRGDYDHRRFAYGGYNFGFVQPWPVGWGHDDDVFVVYTDGGYYMYNRAHPGLRLSINIL
jgi:hypothetical protein